MASSRDHLIAEIQEDETITHAFNSWQCTLQRQAHRALLADIDRHNQDIMTFFSNNKELFKPFLPANVLQQLIPAVTRPTAPPANITAESLAFVRGELRPYQLEGVSFLYHLYALILRPCRHRCFPFLVVLSPTSRACWQPVDVGGSCP